MSLCGNNNPLAHLHQIYCSKVFKKKKSKLTIFCLKFCFLGCKIMNSSLVFITLAPIVIHLVFQSPAGLFQVCLQRKLAVVISYKCNRSKKKRPIKAIFSSTIHQTNILAMICKGKKIYIIEPLVLYCKFNSYFHQP